MSKWKLILSSFLATSLAFVLCVVLAGFLSVYAEEQDNVLEVISYMLFIGGLSILPPCLLINYLVIFIIIKSELPLKKLAMLWGTGVIIMTVFFLRGAVLQTHSEYTFYIFFLLVSSMFNVFFVMRNKHITT